MDDYKEKYEHALDNFKRIKAANKDNKELVDFIEYEYPELKESEDERIRKEILEYFQQFENEELRGVKISDWIAWLEKQGEQKPADKVIKEEKPLSEKFKQAVYDCAWGKVTCKKEGETKEEYANRWAEQLLILVRDWADDYIDSREDVIRRRFFDKGKQSIQKPTWSEEDEMMLENAISSINHESVMEGLKSRGISYSIDSSAHLMRKLIAWLNSLKERYTWKPSDEQMKQLGWVAEQNKDNMIGKELMSLYQDLKKLREE